MNAVDKPFTQFLDGAKQFIIPIFQRTYSWEPKQCEQLWQDVLRVGARPDLPSHFVGSVVYIPEVDTNASIPRWLVIDGQQRITTLTLLLLALMRRLEEEGDEESPISAEEIGEYYLWNRHGKKELRYRMLLTDTDRDTLIALVDGDDAPVPASVRLKENYDYFCDEMKKADVAQVFAGVKKLMIVDVALQQGIDNPQMIFESMNSTGKALTQADLIRNYVLMGQPHDDQTRLYQAYWRKMELAFGAEGYARRFDEFMRFFLVIHTGNHRIRKGEVYDEFKAFARDFETEDLLASLYEYAGYYCRIALDSEDDAKLGSLFRDIRELRADVVYPFLMEVYRDYSNGLLTKPEFAEVILLVESYVFRRVVCDIPTNSQRLTFATLGKRLKKDRYLESLKAVLLLLPSYRRFPSDEEFKRRFQERNLYGFNRRSYWLRRFENYKRREPVAVNELTIEHIMPQTENLSPAWKADLGEDWKRVHEEYLHTLGNLTLTAYNSEFGARSFKQKRDMEGGFAESPLKLNQGLGSLDTWNETEIQNRAKKLSARALNVWPSPGLEPDVLPAYREADEEQATDYSIEDHPQLAGGITRKLFDAFREEVLSLDEVMREQYWKLYVAFKAETNVVDVVPQSKRLRLSLNMTFPEIDDPRGICNDVTHMGRWGNGDVEVFLEDLDDIPYIMGLVRQALECQMGDVSEEA